MESSGLGHSLIRSKRRTICLEFNPQGQLIVRAPLRASLSLIKDFIHSKRNWIEKNQQHNVQQYQAKPQRHYQNGESFLLLGESYPLEIVPHLKKPLHFDTVFQLSERNIEKAEKIFTAWYKKRALSQITEITEKHATIMQLSYSGIKITSARKRWGSCNSRGNLSFSWRLVMAPIWIIEYIVVHELAHLKHMNHSSRFWGFVGKFFPEYKKARKWLKEHQALLDL